MPLVLFSTQVNNVWTASCAPHHSGAAPSGSLDLSAGVAYLKTVGVPAGENPALFYVDPGDTTNSYLYQKAVTGAMPYPLADIPALREWILNGAPNN